VAGELAWQGRIGGALAIGAAIGAGLAVVAQGGPEPPGPLPGWLVTIVLLGIPGAIGFVGGAKESAALLAAAGAICLCQAFIAMSGVTIPFILPAVVFLVSAAGSGRRLRRADLAVSAVVVGGWLASWVARLALTEERCDPIPGGTSCGSNVPTSFGTAVALSLAVATVAIATLAGRRDVEGR
jgi:hypothetical protein